jgi:hypothetical protein
MPRVVLPENATVTRGNQMLASSLLGGTRTKVARRPNMGGKQQTTWAIAAELERSQRAKCSGPRAL